MPEEGNILTSALAFHFLPRVAYRIYLALRTPLALVALVLTEGIGWGSRGVFLISVRMGYLGGTYLLLVLEHVGIAELNVRSCHRPWYLIKSVGIERLSRECCNALTDVGRVRRRGSPGRSRLSRVRRIPCLAATLTCRRQQELASARARG